MCGYVKYIEILRKTTCVLCKSYKNRISKRLSKYDKCVQMREKLNRLKLCITILLILEMLAGVILIGMTARYHRVLGLYLAKGERQMLVAQLCNVYLLGFELFVIYSVGLFLWQYIWKSETIIEHAALLAAWNSFCLLIVLCGSVTVWFLYNSTDSLQNTAASSLFEGIDLYFTDPEWKLLWDGIQYHNECCGVHGYEDWKDASWMPEEESKCQKMSDSILMLIPYACCKRSSKSCFQNYVPQNPTVPIPYLNSTDINTSGCLPKFNNTTSDLIFNLSYMMVSGIVLQILQLIMGYHAVVRAKKLSICERNCSDNNDERPLVVVKYPRNVRCVTLTDEENFDEVDYDDEEHYRHSCRTPASEGIFVRQEITESSDRKQPIFLH